MNDLIFMDRKKLIKTLLTYHKELENQNKELWRHEKEIIPRLSKEQLIEWIQEICEDIYNVQGNIESAMEESEK